MEFEKQEELSKSLDVVKSSAAKLIAQGNELTERIISETDPSKLDDLTQLFNINQKKKDIARVNRLSNLLELVDDEAITRFTEYPDAIDNDQLIAYMRTTQQAIQNTTQSINQTPLIQINNTKAEINVNNNISGLDRQSRERVLNVVNSILAAAKTQDEDVFDVTPD